MADIADPAFTGDLGLDRNTERVGKKTRRLGDRDRYAAANVERGVPVTVFRIPSNFPPIASKGRTFAGMGTPDLRGTYGTFSYYTDDPMVQTGEVEGVDDEAVGEVQAVGVVALRDAA